jgi:hypothetical protein
MLSLHERHLRYFVPRDYIHIEHTTFSYQQTPRLAVHKIGQISLSLTMRMTRTFTSQIPLLVGIEILTIVAFVLSILALCAGISGDSLKESAILTV